MGHPEKSRVRRPGIILFILILLFFIPLAIAWFMYRDHDSFGGKPLNHGQLITPPFSITLLKLRKRPHKKWLILYLNPGPCDTRCQKGLYHIRQIRLATGKNRNRVQPAILIYRNKTKDITLQRMLKNEYQETRLFFINKNQFNTVIQRHVKTAYALQPGTIYLVDPLGNVMMSYKPDTNPSDIFKDVQRLLKASQIG